MTREEIENSMTLKDAIEVFKSTNAYGTMDIAKSVILKALGQKPCDYYDTYNKTCRRSEVPKAPVLDEIREEIMQLDCDIEDIYFDYNDTAQCEMVHTICREEVLQIIDRYKVESEDKEWQEKKQY